MLHRGMHRGSEQKCHTDLCQAGCQSRWGQINLEAESLDHVRRTAFRSYAAVTVFGYTDSSARDHEGCCGGDVKSSPGVAASAAGVDESVAAGAADVYARTRQWQRRGGGPNRFRETDNLFDSFTFHVQRDQESCDLRIGALAGKNLGHDGTCFFSG